MVADGNYKVYLSVTDSAGRTTTSLSALGVEIDTLAPTTPTISVSNAAFSPNGDNIKDTTTIGASLAGASTYSLEVRNAAGTTKRTFAGSGGGTLSAVWDGRESSGSPPPVVADGTYTPRLTLIDAAGNSSFADGPDIAVDTLAPTMSGGVFTNSRFSPNNDGRKDSTSVSGTLSEEIAWTMRYIGTPNIIVRSFNGSSSTVAHSWDGRDSSGVLVAEGAYRVQLDAADIAGNYFVGSLGGSVFAEVIVDVTAPTVNFTSASAAISPHWGSYNSTTFSASANEPLGTNHIRILNSVGDLIASPGGFAWNGTDSSGSWVADGTYTAELYSLGTQGPEDLAGNRAASTSTIAIGVDRIYPDAFTPTLSNERISPNGDGQFDSTTISGSNSDWASSSLSVNNQWQDWQTGSSFNFVWAPSSSSVSNGPYTMNVMVRDAAGNRTFSTATVTVDKSPPSLTQPISLSVDGTSCAYVCRFSPNGDGTFDTVAVSAGFGGDPWAPATWKLEVLKMTGSMDPVVWSTTGAGAVAATSWDGTDFDGASVEEGLYRVSVIGRDGGLNGNTTGAWVEIDLTPITATGLAVWPNPFAPDQLPPQSTIISAGLSEATDWVVEIEDLAGTVVRTMTGSSDSLSVSWDGKNASGVLLPEGAYRVVVHTKDDVGNDPLAEVWATIGQGPTIAAVIPPTVQMGTTFTVTGTGFGPAPDEDGGDGVYGVTLGEIAAYVTEWSNTSITAVMPTEVDAGSYELAVTRADLTSLPASIDVPNYVLPPDLEEVETDAIAIKLKPGVSLGDLDSALPGSTTGVKHFESDDPSAVLQRWYDISIPSQSLTGLIDVIKAYAADDAVEWAEYLGGPIELHATFPNDARLNDQWGLHQASNVDINAPQAWDTQRSASHVRIAIVDSGIGPHPDIDSKIRNGRDFVNPNNPDTSDGCTRSFPHGTAVASTAAAVTNNTTAIAGVAWNATVRPYKIFHDVWQLNEATNVNEWMCRPGASVAQDEVVRRAARDDVQIINMSYGGPCDRRTSDTILQNAADGLVMIASAGNDNTGHGGYCPAMYGDVLAIGAINQDGERATGWGPNGDRGSNFHPWVRVYAPGDDFPAAVRVHADRNANSCPEVTGTTGTCDWRGTSAAAPIVSGIAALLRNETNDENAIVDAIVESRTRQNANQRRWPRANVALNTWKDNVIAPRPSPPTPQPATINYPPGAWVKNKAASNPIVYLLTGSGSSQRKRQATTGAVLKSWGLTPSSAQVTGITANRLKNIQSGPKLGFRPGSLITTASDPRSTNAQIWLVTNEGSDAATSGTRWMNGYRRSIQSLAFTCLGYNYDMVLKIGQSDLSLHSATDAVPACRTVPNGTVYTAENKTWMVEDGKRREFKHKWVRESWGITDLQVIKPVFSSAYSSLEDHLDNGFMGYRPGSFVRVEDQTSIWFVTSSFSDFPRPPRRRIVGGATGNAWINCYKFSNAQKNTPVTVVDESDGTLGPAHEEGGELTC